MLKPSLQIHDAGGVLLAEFWDCLRLDPAPTLELRGRFDEHMKAKGRPLVVVDLSGVGFAGSAALGNFVALQRTARQYGGRVIFCRVEPTVVEVFRASNLDRLFEFHEDRESALASAERGEPDAASRPADKAEPERQARPGPAAGRLGPLRRNRPTSDSERSKQDQ